MPTNKSKLRGTSDLIPPSRIRGTLLLSAAIAAAALLLPGCKIDQDKEVAQYRKVLDDNQLLKTTTPPKESEALTLTEALSLANRNNENLGLRGEDYVQSLIDKNRAVSNFLPTVSFQPNYTLADKPTGHITRSVGTPTAGAFRVTGDTEQRFEAPVVGSINVFRGFGDVHNLRATEAIIAQRRELLLDLQATILLNVAQSYYQVLRSERAASVLQHSLDLQTARLSDITQQFNNGLATRLAVAQTRAQVDATRVSLVQTQSDVRNGRSVLANVIGLSKLPNPLADTFPTPPDIGEESEWEHTALNSRPDIRATQDALVAAREQVKVATSQYWPSVGVDVQGFLYREFYGDASKWNAILSANIPLFSAGRIRADVRTAWSRLRQAALEDSAVRRQAIQDVQVAHENYRTTARRITELQDQQRAADEAYQQSLGAFQNGLAINLDVLTSLNDLLNAQLQLAAANFDRTVFYLDLVRATGRLVDEVGTKPTTRPTTQPTLLTRAP